MEFLRAGSRGGETSRGSNATGFSLVELLAVMALLATLMGMLGTALLQSGSISLEGAERLAGAYFMQARQQALLQKRNVRVLIHADPSDPDRYLRELEMVRYRGGGEWAPLSGGQRLPRGFFFHPARSLGAGTRTPEILLLDTGEGRAVHHYYFEYNSRGECLQPGAQFVIEPGRLEPVAPHGFEVVPPRMDFEERRMGWGGFLLLRLGGLLFFPDPESIK